MHRPADDPPFAPIPAIDPVPEGVDRPSISVMVPTYECGDLLEQTLRGVLDQDPGADRMQIAVVDDRSSSGHHERIIRALAPSRIEYHRQEQNVGLARNWNGCIARSRGRWVHLLHQDDLVSPGFYERLGRADVEAPEAGAAFCRHGFLDGEGHLSHLMKLERPTAGILDGWLGTISRTQNIQCPAIIVRRDVYERLGGFRTDLPYALDWEMWNRIAAHYPYWYEPEPLAYYRIHDANETARLRRADRDLDDIHRAIRMIAEEIPPAYSGSIGQDLLAYLRGQELRLMILGFSNLDIRLALAHMRRVDRCDPKFKYSRAGINYAKWTLKILLLEGFKMLRGRRRPAEVDLP